jgi:major membrane immunogen (membrane-anchored lipoprotein)
MGELSKRVLIMEFVKGFGFSYFSIEIHDGRIWEIAYEPKNKIGRAVIKLNDIRYFKNDRYSRSNK